MAVLELLKKLTQFFKLKMSFRQMTTKMKLVLAFAALVLIKMFFKLGSSGTVIKKISITEFLNPLNMRLIQKVKIFPDQIIGLDSFGNKFKSSYPGFSAQYLYEGFKKATQDIDIQYIGHAIKNSMLDYLIFFISLACSLLIYYLYKKDDYDKRPSKPEQKIKFQDIVGLDTAKNALKEVIDFMKDDKKYKERGARMRRGVLLYGPPGTGKTTLAKACANQAGVNFYSCNGAQFCQIYVGMGPKKVRQLFAKARQNSPAVIFIDELDALGSRSSQNNFMMQSANSQKNSTINQILSELDGFETTEKILVIAATNRLEMVDKSLVRAGRFDLKIEVKMPDLEARVKIFHKYVDKTRNSLSDKFIREMLGRAVLASGADIEALVNEAIHLSIRRNSDIVQEEDILNAIKHQSG